MGALLSLVVGKVMRVVKAVVDPHHGVAWRRLAGLGLVAWFVMQLVGLWNPVYRFTGLLQMGAINETSVLSVLREVPVAYGSECGYDGQFYAQIACDPSLRNPELATAIDSLPYRARRILMPVAAWVLGLGRPQWVIQIFPWLNIACWFALAVVLWPLLQAERHWRGLLAWAGVLFSAGVLASVRLSLTDLPALLLFALVMRASGLDRPSRSAAWLASALLCRETVLAGAWGLFPKPWDTPRRLLRVAGWVALAVLPLGLWLVYIRWQVGQPSGGGLGNFSWPGSGFVGRWRESLGALRAAPDPLLAWASFLTTVATTAQLVFLLRCFAPQDRWWRVGAGFAALLLMLGGAVWEGYPGASPRVLLPLLLACSVLVIHRGRAGVWLLLLNLSVPAGLLEMQSVPDVGALAATRMHGTAAMLHADTGCYASERLGKNCWGWTEQDARWRLQFWTDAGDQQATLYAKVRALDERELVITWAGGELWRGRVGNKWTHVRLLPVPAKHGTVLLTLRSDQPAVREGPGRDARWLSVCLLNSRIELSPAPTAGASPSAEGK